MTAELQKFLFLHTPDENIPTVQTAASLNLLKHRRSAGARRQHRLDYEFQNKIQISSCGRSRSQEPASISVTVTNAWFVPGVLFL